jgi:hypothetical protein
MTTLDQAHADRLNAAATDAINSLNESIQHFGFAPDDTLIVLASILCGTAHALGDGNPVHAACLLAEIHKRAVGMLSYTGLPPLGEG